MNIYIVPAGANADEQLANEFRQVAGGKGMPGEIELLDRQIPVRRLHEGTVWFDFATLCGGPRSQNDYLDLARRYHTIFLSDIPVMTRDNGNEARRFTWLVDVLYDCRVKLIISAAAEAPDLYREGPNAQEFPRTVSRLIEMRSREYLAERHRPV